MAAEKSRADSKNSSGDFVTASELSESDEMMRSSNKTNGTTSGPEPQSSSSSGVTEEHEIATTAPEERRATALSEDSLGPSHPQALATIYADLVEQLSSRCATVSALALRFLSIGSLATATLLLLDKLTPLNVTLFLHALFLCLGWLSHFLFLEYRSHQSLARIQRSSKTVIASSLVLLLMALSKAILSAIPLRDSGGGFLHGNEAVLHFVLTILSTLEAVGGATANHSAVQLAKILKVYADSGLLEQLSDFSLSAGREAGKGTLERQNRRNEDRELLVDRDSCFWELPNPLIIHRHLRAFYVSRWLLKAASLVLIVLASIVLGNWVQSDHAVYYHRVTPFTAGTGIGAGLLGLALGVCGGTSGVASRLKHQMRAYAWLSAALLPCHLAAALLFAVAPVMRLVRKGQLPANHFAGPTELLEMGGAAVGCVSAGLCAVLGLRARSLAAFLSAALFQPYPEPTVSSTESSGTITI